MTSSKSLSKIDRGGYPTSQEVLKTALEDIMKNSPFLEIAREDPQEVISHLAQMLFDADITLNQVRSGTHRVGIYIRKIVNRRRRRRNREMDFLINDAAVFQELLRSLKGTSDNEGISSKTTETRENIGGITES